MTGGVEAEPHSAAFFGKVRDYWWNRDHLELISARLNLGAVRTVLDVGCGPGHWGRLLGSVLSSEATVVGIDREPKWIAEAIRVAQREAQAHRFGYQEGIAEELPFDDASFDLVTCQTLLIHVREPRRVIREMLRVLEPGGLLLAAEPNNRGPLLVQSSANADAPIDELLDLVKFELTCERGKAALGEGDNSLGDLLPGLLAEQGAVSIQTFLSDKTAALFPPYDSEEQQALRAHLLEQAQRHDWGWSREEARRYFLAGDGSSREFDTSWRRRLEENDKAAATVLEGKYHSAGATILYLVAGRRPPDATESKHRSAGCSIYPR